MIKGFGLCGAHATGKTTIAESVAKELGIEFIPSQTSSVFKSLGMNPQDVLSPGERLYVQTTILSVAEHAWEEASQRGHWVSDRTPFDFMTYLINDSFTWEDSYTQVFEDYLERCFKSHKEYFGHTILVQPDGVIWERDSSLKGRNSRVLQNSMNVVYRGLLSCVEATDYTILDSELTSEKKKVQVYDILLDKLHN